MTNKKVAVISSYYQNWNMGGLLQAYALNRTIRDLGYDAEHIRLCYTEPADADSAFSARVRTVLTRHRLSSELIERFFAFRQHETKNRKNFRAFHDHEIHGSTACCDATTVERLNRRYDVFVTGSDQIWNPQFWSDRLLGVFGLLFAEAGKRTLSYAASIGSEKAVAGKEDVFRTILQKLDGISVREDAAQTRLQPLTDKPVQVVVDPTLLLKQEEWEHVARKKENVAPYVFAYFLKEAEPHTHQLFYLADRAGVSIRCYASEKDTYVRPATDEIITDAGPKEFLALIRDSQLVVTNSFHGMVFSVLFHKPFWVVKRYKDTAEDSANNRIIDFLRMFRLEERLLEDGEFPDDRRLEEPIDYDRIDQILSVKRAESLEWLRGALDA